MSVNDQEVAEAIRIATNEFGLADLLVAENWDEAGAAIDAGMLANGIVVKRGKGFLEVDLAALRTATNERRFVSLILREQWHKAARAIAESYID